MARRPLASLRFVSRTDARRAVDDAAATAAAPPLHLTRAADTIVGGGRGSDNPRTIRARLYHSVSRSGARVADSRVVGLSVSRETESGTRRCSVRPSIREKGSRMRRENTLSLLSPSLSPRLCKSLSVADCCARARSLSSPSEGLGEQQRRQKQDLQER